jgi:chromosome partitioning protein
VGDMLIGKVSIEDVIIKNGKLSLIPASEKLLDYEFQLNNEPGREYMLREQLEKVSGIFDFILIDCPPSLGTLSTNSLVAAHHFIVPMQAENFAFIGLDRIMLISEKVKKRMNPSLDLAGILFVKLDPRTKFSQAVIQSLTDNQNFSGKLFNTYIRQDISLMESGAFKQTVFDYAPKSRGSEDYTELAKEILKIYG